MQRSHHLQKSTLDINSGDCIYENNNIYISLTSTTLSRQLIMHLFDTSWLHNIWKTFLPKNWVSENSYWKHNNIRKTKNYKFLKCFISERNYLNSIESISNPVLMYLNVFTYCCYSQNQFKNKTQQHTNMNNRCSTLTN